MARLARIVVPDVPHHVTQRGNRRQEVFFGEEDYAAYQGLIAAACAEHRVRCLAWCLMPNHVHLILTPPTPEALRAALGEAHRRYSRRINFAKGWTGYLWQGTLRLLSDGRGASDGGDPLFWITVGLRWQSTTSGGAGDPRPLRSC